MHLNQMQVQMWMNQMQLQVQVQMHPPQGTKMQVQIQMHFSTSLVRACVRACTSMVGVHWNMICLCSIESLTLCCDQACSIDTALWSGMFH